MIHQDLLHAGAAQIDITPPLGTRINGDFVTHFATQIHDPLYAKCLMLKTTHDIFAFIVVDICTMSQSYMDAVKSKIQRQSGIPAINILMASTHTHAAGAVEEVHLGGLDKAYRDYLLERIPEVALEAKRNMQPAKIAHGRVLVPEHVLCRRYYMKDTYSPVNPVTGAIDIIKTNPIGVESQIDRPAGEVDPDVSWLGVKSVKGNWISVLANYSLHYVGDWENGTISADYFGFFANALQSELDAGDDFVGIMTNGTSGDINIWDFEGKKSYPSELFAKSRMIGEDIAGRVKEDMLKTKDWNDSARINVERDLVELQVRKPNDESLAKARKIVESSDFKEFNYSDEDLRKAYAREQILLDKEPDQRTAPLMVVKIGNLRIGSLPGEFFAETGLWLKRSAPDKNYFTIGLAEGNVGYVPPAAEHDRGGYETWRCRYSCLEKDAEKIIREKMKVLINRID